MKYLNLTPNQKETLLFTINEKYQQLVQSIQTEQTKIETEHGSNNLLIVSADKITSNDDIKNIRSIVQDAMNILNQKITQLIFEEKYEEMGAVTAQINDIVRLNTNLKVQEIRIQKEAQSKES